VIKLYITSVYDCKYLVYYHILGIVTREGGGVDG